MFAALLLLLLKLLNPIIRATVKFLTYNFYLIHVIFQKFQHRTTFYNSEKSLIKTHCHQGEMLEYPFNYINTQHKVNLLIHAHMVPWS